MQVLDALHLSVYQRQARFRAWREYGVPVGWCWTHLQRIEWSRLPGWRIEIWCLVCKLRGSQQACDGYLLKDLGRVEDLECRALLVAARCPHLAPLLGDDPPEVKAIYEIELLAGGAA